MPNDPPYQGLRKLFDDQWKQFGKIDVILLQKGFYVFVFGSKEMKMDVTEQESSDSTFSLGRPLIQDRRTNTHLLQSFAPVRVRDEK